ncbi:MULTISPECIES: citrate/2-methylcitrate synthase [unclassified Duganella]|uniref:citrate/2-methylcitrate synthase n=1 Tax=unclassified Duganella TaxID=2636909 RepID=UPI000E34F14F|nr:MULTISPECIES: citrate/2-methylcitrate synthase [unclassified Duganella]RFP16099.1 citrate synthase [Duganella sp. BJB475]RFP32738.1 citrate synthase [Duganella sp. BJB476]
MVWMTAAEALNVLNVRPQTLYANVSRGKIRAKSDEADPRRSLYHRDDILRMARRSNGRRKIETVSAQAMQWGDPVLPSAISTAADGHLLYRGRDAVTLSETATLEEIADLLWEAEPGQVQAATAGASPAPAQAAIAPPASALGAGLLALALRSASDVPSMDRTAADLRTEAASILATLTEAMIGPALASATAAAGAPPATISQRLALAWQRPASEDLLRRALVLMADHELNASTFATRVAISTGASLAAGVLAGFTTLTGPLHGGASAEFAQLAAAARAHGAEAAVATWRASGRALPGFGHMLYAQGDPRARALMKLLPELQPHADLAAAAEAQAGELPNIDFALTLLAAAHGLPDDAPFILFALGRCVGWLAHALEQVQARRPIRPRARYIGPSAGTC